MDLGGTTWVITADARQARIFAERVRGGELREIPDWRVHAQPDESESRFLKRLADRLGVAAGANRFDHLVLMAPPHALGVLRAALSSAVAAKVEASDPHERSADDTADLRVHLRDARARVHA